MMFARALDHLHRREGARLLALLIHRIGRFDVAEEAMQDAYAKALSRWPVDGMPAKPEAWLLRVALNRAIDIMRRQRLIVADSEARLASIAAEVADPDELESTSVWPDERLRLIFTCCHPAIAPSAQIALSLKTLCGLTTAEIARAFVEPEATTAQKIVRAKKKIAAAGIPFVVPAAEQIDERLVTVLAVIYFVFNEGYTAAVRDSLLRADLCREALRLGATLNDLLPGKPEVQGLVALMAFHHARRDTRCDSAGHLVPLDLQDRSRWDHAAIAQADLQLRNALAKRQPGPYQLQAAIAALHARAPEADATDWPQIALLYRALLGYLKTPVVELNAAVALAMSGHLDEGLEAIDRLAAAGDLSRYHLLHAAHAELLRRAGRIDESALAYERAIGLARNTAERTYLEVRRHALMHQ